MKYSIEQKETLLKKGKEKFRVRFCIENRIKNNYPIKVEIIEGFYVIESKMNEL